MSTRRRTFPSFPDFLVQDPHGPAPILRIRAEYRDIFGEPDVKGRQGRKRMEEEDITEVMARMVRDFSRQRERRDEVYEYDRREFD